MVSGFKTQSALRRTGEYKGILDAINKIYKIKGHRTFWRGYVPNICGVIPYAGIDLAIYEVFVFSIIFGFLTDMLIFKFSLFGILILSKNKIKIQNSKIIIRASSLNRIFIFTYVHIIIFFNACKCVKMLSALCTNCLLYTSRCV